MVSIKNLHKRFGKNQVLKGVDLNINEGGILPYLDQMDLVKPH